MMNDFDRALREHQKIFSALGTLQPDLLRTANVCVDALGAGRQDYVLWKWRFGGGHTTLGHC